MDTKLLTWILVLVCIFGLANSLFILGVSSKVKAGVSEDELKTAIGGIPITNLTGIEERLDSIELEVAELVDVDVSEEDEAERLVLAELDTRDFKEDVMDALNLFYNVTNSSDRVDRYRHITDIVVKDLDVVYEDEEANVTVDLKVYYYVDGDEDETEKARLDEIVFTVTDLDKDEDFEDAEVEDWKNLVVAKVY